MGNDGGSIPKRRELVKEAARAPTASQLKESLSEQQSHNWTTCPLSNKSLQPPIVSDYLGRLFNKDSVLEYLLGSVDEEGQAKIAEMDKIVNGTIKSVKDTVEVLFEQDNEVKRGVRFVCPVTNKALGPGGAKAVYLVPCGHAFSAEAIRQLSDERSCPQCADSYEAENVIPILPTSEDVKSLEKRILKLREQGLSHALKKSSSKKKRKHGDKESESKANGTKTKATPSINNAATASLTAKVLSEQDAKIKKRKLQNNDNLNSLFSNRTQEQKLANSADFMTRGFVIPSKTK
jgi:hypothetical protein